MCGFGFWILDLDFELWIWILAGFSAQNLTRLKSNRCLGLGFHLKLFLFQYDLGYRLLASSFRALRNHPGPCCSLSHHSLLLQASSRVPAAAVDFTWLYQAHPGKSSLLNDFFIQSQLIGNFDYNFKISFSIRIQSWEWQMYEIEYEMSTGPIHTQKEGIIQYVCTRGQEY